MIDYLILTNFKFDERVKFGISLLLYLQRLYLLPFSCRTFTNLKFILMEADMRDYHITELLGKYTDKNLRPKMVDE